MTVRWRAVLLGLLVDYLLTTVIQAFARPTFLPMPDLTNQGDLIILLGSAVAIGIGGYVSGRIANADRVLNGIMVGVLDVLLTALSVGAMSRPVVYLEALGCGLAALGGFLSQFPRRTTDKPDMHS